MTQDETRSVLEAANRLGPPFTTAIHLEVQLGFRRVSVIRATLGDFNGGSIMVRGKGHDYVVPPHPRTPAVIKETLDWRRSEGFDGVVDSLIPARSRRLRNTTKAYSERGMDGILARVSKESQVRFSNHDLRRTFGRSLWKAGVKIETISELLGQRDIKTTLLYLGINLTDMADALQRLHEWME